MQSPKPNTPVSRHEDFWFTDGSVVLVVENTAFRIHQSILSRHSDVFADMFTVPQPDSNDADHFDGCPIVHLTDPLEDFVDVMKAIYEPFYFDNLAPNAELPALLSFISGILRISTKYNLQMLREKCIAVLRTKFPSTLAGCDALLSSGYQYVSSAIVRAIPLARESNVPEILPWAFYISTHIAADALLADPFLSWQDKALCLAGKDKLWNAQIKHTHQFVFDFTRSTACVGACRGGPPQTLTWQETEGLRVSPHPLDHYEKWNTLKVCPKCLAHAEWQHQVGRGKVWDMLPSIFHLGSWDDIHKDQNR